MSASKDTKPRLAIIISHPIQYWVPVYRHLANMPELDIRVFFVAENGLADYFDAQFNQQIKWDVPLTDGYSHEFLQPGKVLQDYAFQSVDAPNINQRLNAFAPDFVWVNGYAHKIIWRVLLRAGLRCRFIVNSDSNLRDSRKTLRLIVKRAVLRYFYQKMHACIACSPNNYDYLRYYGVPERKIVHSVMPVDIQRLQAQANQLTQRDREQLKTQLSIGSGDRVLLFAGKLIAHKRPQDVLRLLARLHASGHANVHAVIIGNGELSDKLAQMSEELNIQQHVHFTGFINQSRLPNYFAISDALVFPSQKEPYGVIATEVLPFGLPILAADNIGAVGSAIIPEGNALTYPCANIEIMHSQAKRLLSDTRLYQRLSAHSRRMADEHDASVLANDIFRICSEPLPIKSAQSAAPVDDSEEGRHA